MVMAGSKGETFDEQSNIRCSHSVIGSKFSSRTPSERVMKFTNMRLPSRIRLWTYLAGYWNIGIVGLKHILLLRSCLIDSPFVFVSEIFQIFKIPISL